MYQHDKLPRRGRHDATFGTRWQFQKMESNGISMPLQAISFSFVYLPMSLLPFLPVAKAPGVFSLLSIPSQRIEKKWLSPHFKPRTAANRMRFEAFDLH
jgi:hypothetical protein